MEEELSKGVHDVSENLEMSEERRFVENEEELVMNTEAQLEGEVGGESCSSLLHEFKTGLCKAMINGIKY